MSKRMTLKPSETGSLESVDEIFANVISCILIALAIMILWALICVLSQAGVEAALKLVVTVGIVSFGIVDAHRHYLKHIGFWVYSSLSLALLWIYLAGSYNYTRDFICLAISFVASLLLFDESRRWARSLLISLWESLRKSLRSLTLSLDFTRLRALSNKCGFLFLVIFLLTFWSISSGLDAWSRSSPLKLDPNRFAVVDRDPRWKEVRVGLALSGGGYRAVLMHAGVLHTLEKLGVPVTHITSVSGGSIIGSFYAAGGDPMALRNAIIDHRFNLTRDLTDIQNALRLPFPFKIPLTDVKLYQWYSFDRTQVQANLLDEVLLAGKKLSDLKRDNPATPKLMVCATDLYTGASLGFSAEGVLRSFLTRPEEKTKTANIVQHGDFIEKGDDRFPCEAPLAQLVAASGAFPGAFSGVPAEMRLDPKSPKKQEVLLADGGITDNSALTFLLDAHELRPDWKIDVAISSDAGMLLGEKTKLSAFEELSRAIDIVYANANAGVKRHIKSKSLQSQLILSPISFINPHLLSEKGESEQVSHISEFITQPLCEAILQADGKALDPIIRDMPADRAQQAWEALNKYKDQSTGLSSLSTMATSDLEILCASLSADFAECAITFLRTSTLRDQFDEKDAKNLFRFGQYLALLNWPDIKKRLEDASKKGSPAPASAIELKAGLSKEAKKTSPTISREFSTEESAASRK